MQALDKLRADPRVRKVYKDHSPTAWWVELHYGWSDGHGGAHCFSETTLRDAARTLRDVVPCECLECKTKGEQWEYYDIDTGQIMVGHKQGEDNG